MKRALPVAVVALATAGCGNPPGGDPGNKRFDELSADRVFAQAPADAVDVRITRTKAYVGSAGFGGKVWQGPSVVVRFTSQAAGASVFDFYERRARSAGWRETRPGDWVKTYPDGAPATLLLVDLRRGRWTLNGGIAPKT